jgi:hypothetical protein
MSVGSAQYLTEISKGKGKAVPLQARIGPEGSRNLSFSDFMTKAQDGDKVVSLTHRPPLPPGNAPGTHFCSVLSRPQGHSAIGRIFMSMKNSNDIRWDRTTVLPICSTAPEPLCYRGPLTEMSTRRISWGSKAERPPVELTLAPSYAIVWNAGNLSFLEPSWSVLSYTGIALSFTLTPEHGGGHKECVRNLMETSVEKA